MARNWRQEFLDMTDAHDDQLRRAESAEKRCEELQGSLEEWKEDFYSLQKYAKNLKEALEDLLDCQNGPPLITEEKRWRAAANKAEKLLGRI